jgi:hypothetical protein
VHCTGPFCGLVDLPIKVLTARDYGLDDIRSTEELMRSLLRNVQMAHNAAAASDGIDVHKSIAEALEHLVTTSALSDFHSQSARAVVAAADFPADFVTRVNVGLKDGRRDGGGHGSRK